VLDLIMSRFVSAVENPFENTDTLLRWQCNSLKALMQWYRSAQPLLKNRSHSIGAVNEYKREYRSRILLVGPEIYLRDMHIFAAAKSKSFTPTVETK
jgi:hypothetical protein